MNWIDKEVAFYDFIWAYGVGAHTNCINQELYEDFAAGGDKFEEMKKLIFQKFPTREIAIKEFETEQNIPAEDRYGRGPKKVKSLAQYLSEYVEQEKWDFSTIVTEFRGAGHSVEIDINDLKGVLEQALDAYESTEQVKIRIERV